MSQSAWSESTRWLTQALTNRDQLTPALQARLLSEFAHVRIHAEGQPPLSGQGSSAPLALFRESLALFRALGDTRATATVLMQLGWSRASMQQDYDGARGDLAEGLALFRQAQDAYGIGWSLHNLGDVARQEGEQLQALAHYDQALPYRQHVGDLSGIGWTLLNSGILLRQRDPAAAHARVAAARDHFQQSGDAIGVVIALADLAGEARFNGDREQAAVCHAQAFAYAHSVHDPAGSARLLQTLGDVASGHQQSTVALQAYQAALDRYTALQDQHNQAVTLGAMGAIWWWQLGDAHQARQLLDAALQRMHPQDHLLERGMILADRGSLDLAAGRYTAAMTYLEAAHTTVQTTHAHDVIALVLLGLGRCVAAQGAHDHASRLGEAVLVHLPLIQDAAIRLRITAQVPRLLPATADDQIGLLLQATLDLVQEDGTPQDQAALLLSVVQYAACQGRWSAAHAAEIACLAGAAAMLQQQGSMPWWADESALLVQVEADARRHLTNTEWHAAWDRGSQLSAVMALQRAQTVLTGLKP